MALPSAFFCKKSQNGLDALDPLCKASLPLPGGVKETREQAGQKRLYTAFGKPATFLSIVNSTNV
jgi:hypothetical protein